MRSLLVFLTVIIGCGKSNLKDLTFKEKGRSKRDITISAASKDVDLKSIMRTLELNKKEKELIKDIATSLLESEREVKLRNIIVELLKSDKIDTVIKIYNRENEIINFNDYSINVYLRETCKYRLYDTLKILLEIYKEQKQQPNFEDKLDVEMMLKLIVCNKIEDIKKIKDLKEKYESLNSESKILEGEIVELSPKIAIVDYIYSLAAFSILYSTKVSRYFNPVTNEISFNKSLLVVGGVAGFGILAIPFYRYFKKFSNYSSKISSKSEKFLAMSNLEKNINNLEKSVEQEELKIVKYLIENFGISETLLDDLKSKCNELKKQKILEYLNGILIQRKV